MAPPLFILSFRHRAALTRFAEGAGWRPFVADHMADAERGFALSSAAVAVIDARGAAAEGLEAVRLLSDSVEANASALLVLLSEGDTGMLDEIHRIGATHFLAEPFSEDQLRHALRFACRHAERAGGLRYDTDGGAPGSWTGEPPGIGRIAARDHLTGLCDGHAARSWLATRLSREDSDNAAVAILLSVTRYEAINRAFGRPAGDSILQTVAGRIESYMDGQNAFVARMAGSEFAVLLTMHANLAEARFLAGQLIEEVSRPILWEKQLVTLGCRAGVAASRIGEGPAGLFRRASPALADAKKPGSTPVRVLDKGYETGAGERLEADLRRALSEDEIEIRFQPQIAMDDGRIVGAEALARWNHPKYGEIGATTLFRVAERSDYLVQLSDHVQRKAIIAAAAWPGALGALRLSVNITAADIVRPGFSAQFLDLVRGSGFGPDRLTVEITEGGLIEDLAAAAELLAGLRGGGVRVAVDDFGTGYSSLAYLKALPLDYLKLDKRLSEDIAGSMRDRIVVRSVIDMARSLGLGVIAEGVETAEQLSLLTEEGCNLYQGFLCAPPVRIEELARMVATQH